MARKDNKTGDAPQKNAGAAATTEQPKAAAQNPDEIAGAAAGDGAGTAPGVTNQPGAGSQADENASGTGAGDGAGNEPGAGSQVDDDAAKIAAKEAATKVAKTKKAAEPKVSDVVAEIGKNLLKSNPDMSVVHMTADGRGFYEKNDAELHARTLNNKAVTPVTR